MKIGKIYFVGILIGLGSCVNNKNDVQIVINGKRWKENKTSVMSDVQK